MNTQQLTTSQLFYICARVSFICMYCVCMVAVFSAVILHISSLIHIQWCHMGSLKLTMVGVFTTQKLSLCVKLGFPPEDLSVKHLPVQHLS